MKTCVSELTGSGMHLIYLVFEGLNLLMISEYSEPVYW
jgi:hypothetical protein